MIIDYLPERKRKGLIPVLKVRADSVPEAWERSLLELWKHGARVSTKYDRPGDPPSKFATMIIQIDRPLKEPRIHRCLPTGGFEDLWIYEKSLIYGARDWWIARGEDYTYHDRLFHWLPEGLYMGPGVDQINDFIIPVLAGQPAYEGGKGDPFTRRAIATTWRPRHDPHQHSTPCLQYVWFQMIEGSAMQPEGYSRPVIPIVLNMEWVFRSHDAYKAAFFNLYALSALHRWVAEKAWQKRQELAEQGVLAEDDDPARPIVIGREVNKSLNYHIYGADFEDAENTLAFKRWLEVIANPQKNFLATDDYRVQEGFRAGREKLRREFKERGVPWPEELDSA